MGLKFSNNILGIVGLWDKQFILLRTVVSKIQTETETVFYFQHMCVQSY